ncbi:MAG: aquaporin [Nanoarchaeota archaeon]|nr:aquaporin [Nanoarchaeota archaeon]
MRQYLAEFIATFALVFIGAGSVLADSFTNGGIGLVGIALAHGLVLMSVVYATGHISGGHVNPAVTISLWFARKIKTKKAVLYVISQLLGGVFAGYLLSNIFTNINAGVPLLGEGVAFGTGIFLEAILTFFLVFVVFATAVDNRAPKGVYGAAIGLVLTFDILMGGSLTGAAMNPARAFGPAFISGIWGNQVVYWIGPIIGGVLAGLIYKFIILDK